MSLKGAPASADIAVRYNILLLARGMVGEEFHRDTQTETL